MIASNHTSLCEQGIKSSRSTLSHIPLYETHRKIPSSSDLILKVIGSYSLKLHFYSFRLLLNGFEQCSTAIFGDNKLNINLDVTIKHFLLSCSHIMLSRLYGVLLNNISCIVQLETQASTQTSSQFGWLVIILHIRYLFLFGYSENFVLNCI